jgi:transcriptional regulator of acetoin/glycerol metabolism
MDTVSSLQSENLVKAWKLFVTKGIILEAEIRPIVARSWQRSTGINPQAYEKPLSQRKLETRQAQNSRLISIAQPIIREICMLSGKNYIEIFDKDGYSLGGYGNSIFPPEIGFNCNEKVLGTNAIGTVLIENTPLEIGGYEHYAGWLHSYKCMAAPIHDASGNVIGVLNITNPLGDLPHWISHVMCLGVKLIENQLLYKSEQSAIQYLRNTFTSIIELLQEGIFLIDDYGKIADTNSISLDLPCFFKREALIGKDVGDILLRPGRDSAFLTPQPPHNHTALRTMGKNNTRLDTHSYKYPKLDYQEYDEVGLMLPVDHSADKYKHNQKFFHAENTHAPEERFIGINPVWVGINKTIENAARYSSNVLLEGETGTGKELIAQIIHDKSRRSGKFVAINCGSIPKELINSELFGYEEGSFTDAKKGGNMGKFEMADSGTIFLDEIGEMPLNMQVNLLRFLQDKIITRVGGNKSRRLDVQIIAATNRDLSAEISKGNFRDDLFYRLNVINIKIPPLRERKDDIPLIAGLLLKNTCKQLDRNINSISDATMTILCQYDWPGNVRELGNIIERAIVNNESDTIEAKDLPDFILGHSQLAINTNRLGELNDLEKTIIISTLKSCNGNVSKTAKILGVSRVTLYRKMNKLNIDYS